MTTSGSSFTQVTPVRDDTDSLSFLTSPPASVTASRDSTVTASRDSAVTHHQLTPSSIPLPPSTPGEDQDQDAGRYQGSFTESPRTDNGALNLFDNKPSAYSSPRPDPRSSDLQSSSGDNFQSDMATTDTVKALFAAATKVQTPPSGCSSRSASLEVDNILNRSQEQQQIIGAYCSKTRI